MEPKPLWIDGKTALVTGSAKRIGKSTALALAKHNVDLVLHYRSSRDEAEAVASECRSMGVKSWTVKADLRNPEQANALYIDTYDGSGVCAISPCECYCSGTNTSTTGRGRFLSPEACARESTQSHRFP